MKTLLIFLLSLPFISKAQLPTKDGKVIYEKIDSSALSKEQLYTKSKVWLSTAFKESKAVIDVDDKEAGTLMGKGNFLFKNMGFTSGMAYCYFAIKIDLRNNKYRMQIYSLEVESNDIKRKPIEDWKGNHEKAYERIDANLSDLVESYVQAINKEDSF